MNVISVDEELGKHAEGSFLSLAKFNTASFSACSITGVSPVWEMHPDTDEFFYILEGEFHVTMRVQAGIEEYSAVAGDMFVIPQGVWHKPAAPEGAKFLFYTPGKSVHSELEDPLNPSKNS